MAAADARLRCAASLAAAVPPLVLIACIGAWGVDVPYWDQWVVAPLMDQLFSGRLDLADVWRQHNDHRVFVPRLVMLGLARLSGWDVRWEMAANVVFAAAVFFATLRLVRRERRWLAAPAVSLLVFNLNQWENWAWGQQLVVLVNVAAVAAGVALLAAPAAGTVRLGGAAVAGTVASYSFANGLLFWPLALPLVWRSRSGRRPRVAAWCAAAAAVIAFFFVDYEFTAGSSSVPSSPGDLALVGAYVAVFVGAPVFAYDGKLAGAGGVLALTAFAVLGARLLRKRPAAAWPWIVLAGYGIGSGVVAAAGRLHLGLELAMSSRYLTMANFFWLGLLGLAFEAWDAAPPPPRVRTLARVAAAVAAASLVAGCVWGGVLFREQHLDRSKARRALAAGTLDEGLPHIYPDNRIPPAYVEGLRRHRLSLFRDVPPARDDGRR